MFRKKLTPEQEAAAAREAQEAAQRAEEARVNAEEEHRRRVADYQDRCRQIVQETTSDGTSAWQYKSIYLELDPQYHDVRDPIAPSLTHLDYWGRRGWEVVATFPRTYAGTEVHRHKKVASGGALVDMGKKVDQTVSLSGNIVGAHVLMRRKVTSESYEWPENWSDVDLNHP